MTRVPEGGIRRRGFRRLKRYRKLIVGDSGADLKSKDEAPSHLEFFHAFDNLAREFGYEILMPNDIKPLA